MLPAKPNHNQEEINHMLGSQQLCKTTRHCHNKSNTGKTPRKRPSPHSKRWWNKQVTDLRREANRLRNTYRRTKHEADKVVWRAKANEYTREIARAKASKWKEYVDNADGKTIWQVKKYVTNTTTSTYIPTLNDNAATNEQKVNTLQKAFFPKPPSADLTDIPQAKYPQEVPFKSQMTVRKIREAVKRLAPDKAPGSERHFDSVEPEYLNIRCRIVDLSNRTSP